MTSLHLAKTKSKSAAWIMEQTDNMDYKRRVERWREQQSIQKFWNLQGTDQQGQESVYDRIILKGILKIIRRCELDSAGSEHDLREGRCGQVSDSQLVTDAHRTHIDPGYVPVRISACSTRSDIRNASATGPHFAVHSCTDGRTDGRIWTGTLIKFVSKTHYSFVHVKFIGHTTQKLQQSFEIFCNC